MPRNLLEFSSGLAFSLAESYFSPAMGRNTFLPGEMAETGEKLPDMFILRCKVHLYRDTIKLLMFSCV